MKIHPCLFLVTALISTAAFVSVANSATVTNTNDAGPGSLRNAIAITAVGGTVDFALSNCPCTITLTSGSLIIDKSLSIIGPGSGQLTISGNNSSRVFDLRAATPVTIERVRISNGAPAGISCGFLVLRNSVVSDNVRGIHCGGGATVSDSTISDNILPGLGDIGAGISMIGGTLSVIRSTISSNYADGAGGGIFLFVGAIATITDSTIEGNFTDGMSVQLSTATVINSTFSGNISYTGAGAISNIAQLDLDNNAWPSTVTLINSTVTNTRSLGIKGNNVGTLINIDDGAVPATFILRNSIVAVNFPGLPEVSHNGTSGGFVSGGYNLIGYPGAVPAFNQSGDQIGTANTPIDARLESLALNGGPTRTHALRLSSPALDKGKAFGSIVDQRGLLRPNDNLEIGNAPGGDGSDIGAFEVQFFGTPTATPTASPTLAGFEADVAARPNGDGAILSTDVTQMRRFAAGLDVVNSATNEFQRADSAPRSTFGDGLLNSSDVVQARRYAAGLDPLTDAGGPTIATDEPLHARLGGSLFGVKVEATDEQGWLRLEDAKDGSMLVGLESETDVAAVSFGLRYDPALGRPLVSAGELSDGAVLTVNDTVAGELTVLIDSDRPLGKSLRLVSIGFENEAPGRSIEFHGAASLSAGNGNSVPVTWLNAM